MSVLISNLNLIANRSFIKGVLQKKENYQKYKKKKTKTRDTIKEQHFCLDFLNISILSIHV